MIGEGSDNRESCVSIGGEHLSEPHCGGGGFASCHSVDYLESIEQAIMARQRFYVLWGYCPLGFGKDSEFVNLSDKPARLVACKFDEKLSGGSGKAFAVFAGCVADKILRKLPAIEVLHGNKSARFG